MSSLEESVRHLAGALDALETRLDDRLQDLAHQSEAADAARRQARTARAHTNEAAEGLADAVSDIKALLNPAGDTAGAAAKED